MKRLAAGLLLALALPVVLALTLPFTETGSRWLTGQLQRYTPLEIEFAGGRLFGEFQLAHLGLELEGLSLQLQEVEAELQPACLWQSLFCFRSLDVRQLSLVVSGAGDGTGTQPARTALRLPVRVSVPALSIGSAEISWPGGSWSQARLDASIRIEPEGIYILDAQLQSSRLALVTDSAGEPAQPSQLPQVWLPFELSVDRLLLGQAGWTVNNVSGQLDELRVSGRWRGYRIELEELAANREGWGEVAGEAQLDLLKSYPLNAALEGHHTQALAWSPLQQRPFELSLGGDLRALNGVLRLPGTPGLILRAETDVLTPGLPFKLRAEAAWQGALALQSLVTVPEDLPALGLLSPWQLEAEGNLERQTLSVSGAAQGLGYQQLQLALEASHGAGRLELEQLELSAGEQEARLDASGTLAYAGGLTARLRLASPGMPLPALSDAVFGEVSGELELDFAWRGGDWRGSLRDLALEGTVNKLPASAQGHLSLDADDWVAGGDLAFAVNGAQGRLWQKSGEAGLALDLSVTDLGRWHGGARGEVSLQGQWRGRGQPFALRAEGDTLRLAGWEADSLVLSVDGPPALVDLSGELQVSDLRNGALRFEHLRLLTDGDASQRRVELSSQGSVSGVLRARMQAAQASWVGRLQPTELAVPGSTWRLDEDVALIWENRQLEMAAHCWQTSTSRLCADSARLGSEGELQLSLAGDTRLLEPWTSEAVLGLGGSLDGALSASWGRAGDEGPLVELSLDLVDGVLRRDMPDGSEARYRWSRLWSRAELRDGALRLDAGIERDDQRLLALDLRMPADRSGELAGSLQLAGLSLGPVQAFVPAFSRLDGVLNGEWTLEGTVDRPLARGRLSWREGSMALVGSPSEARDINLQIDLDGVGADIEGAATLGDGPLTLAGRLDFGDQPGLRLELRGERNELRYPPGIEVVVSPDLVISAVPGRVGLSGTVAVLQGSLRHAQLPPDSVDLSSDVVEVDYTGTVIGDQRALGIEVDVRVRIADQFRVLGDSFEAVVGGDLQLRQALDKPLQLYGNLNVVGGEIHAYGQHLAVRQGRVSFAGLPENPELDLRAEREIPFEQVTAGVSVTGTLEEPRLTVYTEPPMGNAEALSYLVRGRGLDAGAGADGTALALSLGTGLVNRSAVVEGLNRLPGLSRVEFGAEGSEDDTAATVSGYIGERIYMSYGVGLYEPVNVLTARLYLQTRLWLEVVSRLESSVDLYYSFDID